MSKISFDMQSDAAAVVAEILARNEVYRLELHHRFLDQENSDRWPGFIQRERLPNGKEYPRV